MTSIEGKKNIYHLSKISTHAIPETTPLCGRLNLILLTSVPTAGYIGQFCAGDEDGCEQMPCGEDAVCMDRPAPMVGYTCECPAGYNLTEDGNRCLGTLEC